MSGSCQKCGTSTSPDEVFCDDCICPKCQRSGRPMTPMPRLSRYRGRVHTAVEDSPFRDYCTTMLYEEEAGWDDD
jgi:hypothetical protein